MQVTLGVWQGRIFYPTTFIDFRMYTYLQIQGRHSISYSLVLRIHSLQVMEVAFAVGPNKLRPGQFPLSQLFQRVAASSLC